MITKITFAEIALACVLAALLVGLARHGAWPAFSAMAASILLLAIAWLGSPPQVGPPVQGRARGGGSVHAKPASPSQGGVGRGVSAVDRRRGQNLAGEALLQEVLHMRKAEWPRLARDILEVPEEILARPQSPVADELSIACLHSGYAFGDMFIQVLRLRALHAEDEKVQERTTDLLASLRCYVLADSMRPLPSAEPLIDLPRGVFPRLA